MPIYEYSCNKCNRHFEYLLRSLNERVLCPGCDSKDIKRLISNFAFYSKGKDESVSSSSSCSGCTSRNCSSCGG